MKAILLLLTLAFSFAPVFAGGNFDQDARYGSNKPWITDIMTWEQLEKSHANIPGAASARSLGYDNKRVLNIYFQDEFAAAVFPDRDKHSKIVNGVEKLLTHEDRKRPSSSPPARWREICLNTKGVDGQAFEYYSCGYKNEAGQVIDPKRVVLNALGRWSDGIKLYLEKVAIPTFQKHGNANEARYLKYLSKELIPYPHFVKFVPRPKYADLMIRIPWDAKSKYGPYRNRDKGNECNRVDTTALKSSKRIPSGWKRPLINLPISNPAGKKVGKCMTENTIVHEVGHALGLTDLYGEKKDIGDQPNNTMMKDLLDFSESHSLAGDDLLTASTLLIQSHYNSVGKKRFPGLTLFEKSGECLRWLGASNKKPPHFGCLETAEAKTKATQSLSKYLFNPLHKQKDLKHQWVGLGFKNVKKTGKRQFRGKKMNFGSVRIGKGVYKGTFDGNWIPDGEGEFYYDSGSLEKQNWKRGRYLGIGGIRYKDGSAFYGRVNIVGGKWIRDFPGKIFYRTKWGEQHTYNGGWKKGKWHGYGEVKRIVSGGSTFIKGNFRNGLLHGEGSQLHMSTKLKSFILTEGAFQRGKAHGKAKVVVAEVDPRRPGKWITMVSCQGNFANNAARNGTADFNIKAPVTQRTVGLYKQLLGVVVTKYQDKGTLFKSCLLKEGTRTITGRKGSKQFKSVFTGTTGNGVQLTGTENHFLNGQKIRYIKYSNGKSVEEREIKPAATVHKKTPTKKHAVKKTSPVKVTKKPKRATGKLRAGKFFGIWLDKKVEIKLRKNRAGGEWGYTGKIKFLDGPKKGTKGYIEAKFKSNTGKVTIRRPTRQGRKETFTSKSISRENGQWAFRGSVSFSNRRLPNNPSALFIPIAANGTPKQGAALQAAAIVWDDKGNVGEKKAKTAAEAERVAIARCKKKSQGPCNKKTVLRPDRLRCTGGAMEGSWISILPASSVIGSQEKSEESLKERSLQICRSQRKNKKCKIVTFCNNGTKTNWGKL